MMRLRHFLAVATIALVGALALGPLRADAQTDRSDDDRKAAAETGLSLGPIPQELDVDRLPDLIPVGEGDEIWGYAYASEVFADVHDPSVDVVAYAIYKADGTTLIGHVIPGRGFAEGTTARETSRAAVIPDELPVVDGVPQFGGTPAPVPD